jgi:cysteine desulfurase
MRPEALEAMLPWLTTQFGNPSGSHSVSRRARQAVDEARDTVAACLGCLPGEVVFTSGGTEADNLAIAGLVQAGSDGHGSAGRPGSGGRAVCSAIEHHAVLHAVEAVGGQIVPVGVDGVIDLDKLTASLRPEVAVVSVMLANNEVGTIQPLAEVAGIVAEHAPGAVLHTDAVQAFAWLDVAQICAPAGLVSVAAHKFGGPQGVGALVVRGGVAVSPLLRGGGQERDLRSGTHNVAGIVAMAAAMEATRAGRHDQVARVRTLRDSLADGIMARVDDVTASVPREVSLPNLCHLRLAGVESEALLFLLDEAGVCASAGSACASGAMDPSHVLTAMGVERAQALTSVRFSLGWSSTGADIDHAVVAVEAAVARLRDGSDRWATPAHSPSSIPVRNG